jgi:hypothetical protein
MTSTIVIEPVACAAYGAFRDRFQRAASATGASVVFHTAVGRPPNSLPQPFGAFDAKGKRIAEQQPAL